MKSLLFAPCYLEGDRLERNLKWLKYYTNLPQLEFDQIFMVDNASKTKDLDVLKAAHPKVIIHERKIHFGRITEHNYAYWYMAFKHALEFAINNNYDRILHLDSDVYLLNNKIVNYVNNLNSGWICPWSEMHKYPDSTFQIICKDQFKGAYSFYSEDFLEFYPYALVEDRLPLTHIERGFKGDRYGELKPPPQQEDFMDYYGQAPNNIEMRFNK